MRSFVAVLLGVVVVGCGVAAGYARSPVQPAPKCVYLYPKGGSIPFKGGFLQLPVGRIGVLLFCDRS